MIRIDPDTRVRIAGWGIVTVFLTLWVLAVIASDARGWEIALIAIPTCFLAFPIASALLIFAAARGPVLRAFAGLAALGGFGWSVMGAWDIFSSHSSTAAIGVIFLPGLQMFGLGAIAIAGAALDALLRLVQRRAAK